MVATIPWVVICDPSHYWMAVTIPWFHCDPFYWMVAPMPWIRLHDHSLDGCVHTTINVSLFRGFQWCICIYDCLQVFGWWTPVPHFHLQSISPLTLVWPSCFRGHLLHKILSLSLYSPRPRSLWTSTVNPTCFPLMKKLPLCPSSWTKQFSFVSFPKNLLFTQFTRPTLMTHYLLT